MKKLSLLLLVFFVKPLFASPLDLVYDAPGDFWGRVDASPDATNNLTHTQFNVEQGVRFEHMKWLTMYGAFTWWQQVSTSKTGYWAAGVKNTTWIPHFVLGIEEEGYVISQPPTADNHIIVGYVSCSADWNLKGGK